MQWIRTLNLYRQKGDNARADAHEELLSRLEAWRDEAAKKLKLAPASVLPSDKARQIAYSKPSQMDALRTIGVRIAGSETILEVLSKWREEFGYGSINLADGACGGGEKRDRDDDGVSNTLPIAFPTPCSGKRWPLFVYSMKNKWEATLLRFEAGEPHEAIAMKQGGRALSPATIVGHLFKAIECGMQVDLNRLVSECATSDKRAPSVALWERLGEAVATSGVDLMTEEKPVLKEILRLLVAHDVDKLPAEKTPEEKTAEGETYSALRWFVSITRAQIPVILPTADSSSSSGADCKRAKLVV
jgi:hypothetical protein